MGTNPFQRKWTDEQREACVFAALDAKPRLSCPKIAEAAAAGRLKRAGQADNLEAFPIPVATVREYMQDAKRKREGYKLHPLARPDGHGLQSIEAITRRAISAMAWKTEEWGSKAAKCDPGEAEKVLRTMKIAAELVEKIEGMKGAGQKDSSPSTDQKSKREPTFAESLAKKARDEKPAGSSVPIQAIRDAEHSGQPEVASAPQGAGGRVLTQAGSGEQPPVASPLAA